VRGRAWLAAAAGIAIAAAGALAWWTIGRSGPSPAHKVEAAAAHFVGSQACAECHAAQQTAWHGSQHQLAMQHAIAGSVLGNFDDSHFTYNGITSTFFRRDGKYFVRTDGPDGKLADFEIKYTYGLAPLQQYLIELPDGRIQALSIVWDTRPRSQGGQRWYHLYPQERITHTDPLHWTRASQNWNFMCSECHSTDVHRNYDAASNTFKTTWSEISVGCEACHGAGSAHLEWARKRDGSPDKGLAVRLDERAGVHWVMDAATGNSKRSAPRTSRKEIETCAVCHARRAQIWEGYVPGHPLADTHQPALLEAGLYEADGQMRDEVYNWGSFLQSRMHAEGVTCSDCHDPHSLKLRAPGNAVCAQCHAPAAFDAESHSHHAKGTAGAECVACHMPATTYMVVDPRHDHSFRIPRPDLTVALGVPNACTSCHSKKTPQWAAEAVDTLWGKERKGYQKFAEAFVAGAAGAPAARGKLLTLIDDPSQPAIVRASAIERIAPWLTPTTIMSLARALNDPDPLVRAAAVAALSSADVPSRQRYLPRMLADPVRIVRMEAALAFAGDGEAGLPPDARAALSRALDEYVAAQVYNADRPEGHVNLGNLYVRRGDGSRAIAEYRKAIAIDPSFVPAYANLADYYRSRGADAEAEAALREGVARNPQAAMLHHALGLALVRQKRMAEAQAALAQAAKLAPDDARFSYVYAIALDDGKQGTKAKDVLEATLKRHPYDRQVLEALASYAARDGKRDAALDYAKTLRDLDPENAQYATMVRQLEQAR